MAGSVRPSTVGGSTAVPGNSFWRGFWAQPKYRYGAIMLAVVTVVGTVVAVTSGGGEDTSTPTAAAGPPAAPASPASSSPSGELTWDDPCAPPIGDQGSGSGAIAGLEHAYYRLRNADAVMSLVMPSSNLDKTAVDRGIQTVPQGTTYCLVVEKEGSDSYLARITEVRPDKRVNIEQRITTWVGANGRVFIEKIEEA